MEFHAVFGKVNSLEIKIIIIPILLLRPTHLTTLYLSLDSTLVLHDSFRYI
jgi:hypothetical protein